MICSRYDLSRLLSLQFPKADSYRHPLVSHQSETCGLEIPEIELTLQPGTLGGRFTTLEGILTQVYEELSDKVFASGGGDSTAGGGAGGSEPMRMGGFEKFLLDLKGVSTVYTPFDSENTRLT